LVIFFFIISDHEVLQSEANMLCAYHSLHFGNAVLFLLSSISLHSWRWAFSAIYISAKDVNRKPDVWVFMLSVSLSIKTIIIILLVKEALTYKYLCCGIHIHRGNLLN